ncbi:MAG: hypothetical protein RH860_13860 [Cytophagales bacterium]
MSDKINVIARKIYEEGLEKAQQESENILNSANSEADQIIKSAKAQAEQIIKEAENKAQKEKKIISSELKLASEQVIESLRQRIKDQVSLKLLDDNLKSIFKDPDFIKSLIIEIAGSWSSNNGFDVKVADSIKSKVEQALKPSLKDVLKNMEIRSAKGLETGFIIEDKKDHYEITFTEEQFREFLKPFIKEKTQKLIFE